MRYTHLALAGTALAIALGGASVAGAAGGDAQITVGTSTTLHAGQTAPFDAAGVKAVRRGRPIPSGYALVGREVTIDRGTAGTTRRRAPAHLPVGQDRPHARLHRPGRAAGDRQPLRRPPLGARRGLGPAEPRAVARHLVRRLPLSPAAAASGPAAAGPEVTVRRARSTVTLQRSCGTRSPADCSLREVEVPCSVGSR